MAQTVLAGVDWERVGQEAVDLLRAYLRFDTSNPPGREVAAVQFLHDVLRREGVEARIKTAAPGRASVIARLRGDGSARPVILMSHVDVVPAHLENWSVPPFTGEVAGGYLYGRGALDMKGPGVVGLMVLLLLHRLKVPLCRGVVFLAVADEEAGGKLGAQHLLEHFGDELDAEFMLNEGSFAVDGGLRPSEVVWAVSCAEKGGMHVRVVAEGRGTHISFGGLGNPHDRLARALVRILETPLPLVPTAAMAEFFRRVARRYPPPLSTVLARPALWRRLLARRFLRDPVTRPLLGDILTLRGFEPPAHSERILPQRSAAVITATMVPRPTVEAFHRAQDGLLERLQQAAGPGVRLEVLDRWEDQESPVDTKLFRAIERVAAGEQPPAPVVPVISPASTDSRFFRPRGVVCYGFCPFVLTREEVARIHGVDERVSLDNVRQGVRRMFEIVAEVCGRGEG